MNVCFYLVLQQCFFIYSSTNKHHTVTNAINSGIHLCRDARDTLQVGRNTGKGILT